MHSLTDRDNSNKGINAAKSLYTQWLHHQAPKESACRLFWKHSYHTDYRNHPECTNSNMLLTVNDLLTECKTYVNVKCKTPPHIKYVATLPCN